MSKAIFVISLLGVSLLHSHNVQPQTTPEMEEQIVIASSKKTSAPLSEALQELIQGISDKTFDKSFFDKIVQAEAKKLTGEYVDHWENGQLKIKANFKEGKVDGHVHGWFAEGQEAFKAFFYENTKVGIHIAFYPYGAPRRQSLGIARLLCYDFEGQLDREQKSSEYDGRLKSLVTFDHGVRDRTTCLYNQERKCIKDEVYDNGKLLPGVKSETKKSTPKK